MAFIPMINPTTRETIEAPAEREQEFWVRGFVRHETEEEEKEIIPANMKKAEVIEELTKREIEHNPKDTVDALRDLLQTSLDTPLVDFQKGAANKEAGE